MNLLTPCKPCTFQSHKVNISSAVAAMCPFSSATKRYRHLPKCMSGPISLARRSPANYGSSLEEDSLQASRRSSGEISIPNPISSRNSSNSLSKGSPGLNSYSKETASYAAAFNAALKRRRSRNKNARFLASSRGVQNSPSSRSQGRGDGAEAPSDVGQIAPVAPLFSQIACNR